MEEGEVEVPSIGREAGREAGRAAAAIRRRRRRGWGDALWVGG